MPDQPDIEGLLGAIQGQIGQSPIHQFSPLGQFGAGLAGLGAGMQGQANPVLEQARLQRDASLRQQLEMIRLQQSVHRERQKQAESQLTFFQGMLTDPSVSPEILKWAAPQWASAYQKAYGQEMPSALVQEMATREMGPERLKAFYRDLASRSFSDEALMQKYSIDPEKFSQHKKAAFTNSIRKWAGMDPVEADEERSLKLERERMDTFFAKHTELKKGSDQAVYATEYARKFGRPLFELSDAQIAEASAAGTARVKAEEIDKEQRALQKALTIETAKEVARERAKIAAEKRKQEAKEQDPKTIASVRSGLILGEQVKALADELGKRGFLSKSEGVFSQVSPLVKRELRSGNPFVGAFNVHSGTMVSLGRAVGDIGGRALAAYASLLEVVKNPKSVQAVQAAVDNLIEAIRDSHPGMDPKYLKVPKGREALMQSPTLKAVLDAEAAPPPPGFTPVKP